MQKSSQDNDLKYNFKRKKFWRVINIIRGMKLGLMMIISVYANESDHK